MFPPGCAQDAGGSFGVRGSDRNTRAVEAGHHCWRPSSSALRHKHHPPSPQVRREQFWAVGPCALCQEARRRLGPVGCKRPGDGSCPSPLPEDSPLQNKILISPASSEASARAQGREELAVRLFIAAAASATANSNSAT